MIGGIFSNAKCVSMWFMLNSDNFLIQLLYFFYFRLLEEKEDRITQLEDRLSEISKEDGDKAQLLETVQSNKTALSRALSQNKELKHQLAELQNGFVKMVSTVDSRYLEFDGTMEKIRVNHSSTQEEL